MQEKPPARGPCVLAASSSLEQKWSKIHNPNANSLIRKAPDPGNRLITWHLLLMLHKRRLHSQPCCAEEDFTWLFALLKVLHHSIQLERPGQGLHLHPPPTPAPLQEHVSPTSPTMLPKELCRAALQLEMQVPSFLQSAWKLPLESSNEEGKAVHAKLDPLSWQ